jgi:hypothetical protein
MTMAKRRWLFAAGVLALTVAAARLMNDTWPRFHLIPGRPHVHHYVWGIFTLTAAGYLALVFHGPRARFWIGALYALGVGLTYDEFGFWINPPFVRGARWNTRGLLLVGGALLIVTAVTMLASRLSATRRPGGNGTTAGDR